MLWQDMKSFHSAPKTSTQVLVEMGLLFSPKNQRGVHSGKNMKFIKLGNKSFLKLKLYQIDSINLFYFFNLIFWFGINSYNRKNSHLWKKTKFSDFIISEKKIFKTFGMWVFEVILCISYWKIWLVSVFDQNEY